PPRRFISNFATVSLTASEAAVLSRPANRVRARRRGQHRHLDTAVFDRLGGLDPHGDDGVLRRRAGMAMADARGGIVRASVRWSFLSVFSGSAVSIVFRQEANATAGAPRPLAMGIAALGRVRIRRWRADLSRLLASYPKRPERGWAGGGGDGNGLQPRCRRPSRGLVFGLGSARIFKPEDRHGSRQRTRSGQSKGGGDDASS